MKIAIVHYHFRRGGVTRVVENTFQAYVKQEAIQLLSLSGESYSGDLINHHQVIDGLCYTNSFLDASTIVNDMEDACRKEWGKVPDVWHIHNHSLGKNVNFPQILGLLVERGAKIILQIHDFAEDGRPSNFLQNQKGLKQDKAVLYPFSDTIKYITNNQRDQYNLIKAGLPPSMVSVLPNPVSPSLIEVDPANKKLSVAPPFTLYPVRGIRRKNLGELIFWSCFAEPDEKFLLSLIPENPIERKPFDNWKQFVSKQKLPVAMGVNSQGYSFTRMMLDSRRIITTSIAEGFGFAFIEPWLYGRPIQGRHIPGITEEFSQVGIALDHLYDRIPIPIEWIGESFLQKTLKTALSKTYAKYQLSMNTESVAKAYSSMVKDQKVDFGRLSEEMQQIIIKKVLGSITARDEIGNPSIPELQEGVSIESIKGLILKKYSLSSYQEKLNKIYNSVQNPKSSLQNLKPESVLRSFFCPESFSFLRN